MVRLMLVVSFRFNSAKSSFGLVINFSMRSRFVQIYLSNIFLYRRNGKSYQGARVRRG